MKFKEEANELFKAYFEIVKKFKTSSIDSHILASAMLDFYVTAVVHSYYGEAEATALHSEATKLAPEMVFDILALYREEKASQEVNSEEMLFNVRYDTTIKQ